MYVYMHICVCVHVYICACVYYVYIYIYPYVHVYIDIYIYSNPYVCMFWVLLTVELLDFTAMNTIQRLPKKSPLFPDIG